MKRLVIDDFSKMSIDKTQEELARFPVDGLEVVDPNEIVKMSNTWHEDQIPKLNLSEIIYVYAEDDILNEMQDYFFASRVEEVEEVDWIKKWEDQMQPIEVAGFTICYPHNQLEQNKHTILIQPAMAFGTGSHETTKLSLMALQEEIKSEEFVYDVGCGSAILSMAARKLGAKEVIGIDIEEDAIENAKENVVLNHLDGISIQKGNLLSEQTKKADIIVANILPHILSLMKDDVGRLLKGNGILILSGILQERVQDIIGVYHEYEIIEQKQENDWVLIIMKRKYA